MRVLDEAELGGVVVGVRGWGLVLADGSEEWVREMRMMDVLEEDVLVELVRKMLVEEEEEDGADFSFLGRNMVW